MIAEYKAVFNAFKIGKELSNSAVWKKRQVVINNIVALLSAGAVIAQGFGYHIPIDEVQITEIVTGGYAVVAFVNTIITYTTTTKIGL